MLAFVLGLAPLGIVSAGLAPREVILLGAFSSSTAGITLAAIEGRKGGVRELLGRLLIWRVGIKGWLAALLSIGPMIVIALYVRSMMGGVPVSWSELRSPASIPSIFLVMFIIAGLGEELGWRAYALPRLQARYSALRSSFIVGVYWALWHIPKYFMLGEGQNDWMKEAGFLSAFLGYAFFLFGWSVVHTWVFNNTRGSALLACVVHGAGNTWCGYLDNYRGDIGNLWALAIVTVAVAVGIIIIAGPEHLSRKNKRNVLEGAQAEAAPASPRGAVQPAGPR